MTQIWQLVTYLTGASGCRAGALRGALLRLELSGVCGHLILLHMQQKVIHRASINHQAIGTSTNLDVTTCTEGSTRYPSFQHSAQGSCLHTACSEGLRPSTEP